MTLQNELQDTNRTNKLLRANSFIQYVKSHRLRDKIAQKKIKNTLSVWKQLNSLKKKPELARRISKNVSSHIKTGQS